MKSVTTTLVSLATRNITAYCKPKIQNPEATTTTPFQENIAFYVSKFISNPKSLLVVCMEFVRTENKTSYPGLEEFKTLLYYYATFTDCQN